ncbi:MAG TPA: hypothetical protein VFV51_05155 [Vicinamibacterales bacterium]|nr:hypothetical protein [Vicinamibacterales bacterium]
MRYLSVLIGVLLFPAIAAGGAGEVVRPVDHAAAVTIRRAVAGSRLVREMLRELERTDLIVHVEMSRDLPGGLGGTTRLVTARGGHRYLRVSIATALPPEARAAILGHELQHAIEIARSRAHDSETLRQFWLHHGYRINDRFFETEAARGVERAIRQELRRSQAEPIAELDHEHLRAGRAKAAAEIAKR